LAAEEYALSPIAAPGRVRGLPLPRREMRMASIRGMNFGQSPCGQQPPQAVPLLISQIMAIQQIKHRTDLRDPAVKIHGTP
jgi:hypothetical protein